MKWESKRNNVLMLAKWLGGVLSKMSDGNEQ